MHSPGGVTYGMIIIIVALYAYVQFYSVIPDQIITINHIIIIDIDNDVDYFPDVRLASPDRRMVWKDVQYRSRLTVRRSMNLFAMLM